MPVEFLCPGCRATLSIARRKIGTGIECPRCAGKIVVPDEFSARAEVVMARLERAARKTGRSKRRPEFSVRRDPPAEEEAPLIPLSAPHAESEDDSGYILLEDASDDAPPVVVAQPPPVALWQAGAAPPFESAADVISARLRERRRSRIGQMGLLIAASAAAFVLGYALGRSQFLADATPVEVDEPVLIEGRITFLDAAGAPRGDAEALLLAVPSAPPSIKLRPVGLNSAAGALADADAEEFARTGGAMTRADDNGSFTLVVPRPGEYRLLWISRQANRPNNELPADDDLDTLALYYQSPVDLIGLRRYATEQRRIDASATRLEHTFR